MSDIVASDHFSIECRIAARDTEARTITNAEIADRESRVVLGTLERLVAEADNRRDRIERVKQYIVILLKWMEAHDWPGFHSEEVVVGTERRPVWKGLLGHRTVPIVEPRATLTRLRMGITSRGEFIEHRYRRDIGERDLDSVIDIEDPQFDLFGFESFFWEFFGHYGIDPDR